MLLYFGGVQKYPRGRRGSPAKGVGVYKAREGSNPSFCAKKRKTVNPFGLTVFLLFLMEFCFFGGTIVELERQRLNQKYSAYFKETLTKMLTALNELNRGASMMYNPAHHIQGSLCCLDLAPSPSHYRRRYPRQCK